MNRRQFFNTAGVGTGGLIVAGMAGSGWRAHQAGLIAPDDSPFRPWKALKTAKMYDPTTLAAAAILAANPHNTQPWQITFDDQNFALHADTKRHLGSFDPFRREMWIGIGCALANAEVVAPSYGFATTNQRILADSDGKGTIFLDITRQKPYNHPLATALPTRRTHRGAYDQAATPSTTLDAVRKLVGTTSEASVTFINRETPAGKLFSEATLQATVAINADQVMSHDGHAWFRGTARKVAQYRDGVSIPTAGLSPLVSIMGQLLPEADAKTSGDYWLAATKKQLDNCSGFGLITVPNLYDRTNQIAIGRLWQRLHLAFTLKGLVAQPMNQLPELVDRDRQLSVDRGWAKKLSAIASSDNNTSFAFRFGAPIDDVPHSARRPLTWVTTPVL